MAHATDPADLPRRLSAPAADAFLHGADDPESGRVRAMQMQQDSPWRTWGPYLSERQWGTVREDYSSNGDAWDALTHEQARSRAYRWGEDGLLGVCDDQAYLCFSLALWNAADPILKERPFGLSGSEGNHGEDVKEYYFFLDNTPSHAYMKALYKYPQRPFPYADLVDENRRRNRTQPEYELVDTGAFAENRYFDVLAEYAKASPTDVVIRLTVTNRGPDPAPFHLLPTLWFRNTWAWGRDDRVPTLLADEELNDGWSTVRADHFALGSYWLAAEASPPLLFTDNETDAEKLFNSPNRSAHVKDGIHRFVIQGDASAVNPARTGTKVAAHYACTLAGGESRSTLLRLSSTRLGAPFGDAEEVLADRISEANAYYAGLDRDLALTQDERLVRRQAAAGLLWSKQVYLYDVAQWLDGDPASPAPPAERATGRNSQWRHLNASDVISMPDTWEYPWFAAWDLAFHCVTLAAMDPACAKQQLVLLEREWYMHPNGQLPAYEWAFGDVNPPVQAWAALHVFRREREHTGKGDLAFLERVFHKLLMNFTWWVNRKDRLGNNVFEGGFLGLDNIGVFDRSAPLPTGGFLEQTDGTAWMGMYCLNMLAISLELAAENAVYEDMATKFFEHFLYIAAAMNDMGGKGIELWDDEDEFFYDVLLLPNGSTQRLRVRSLVGLLPLLAVEVIEPAQLNTLPEFKARMEWFLENRPDLAGLVARWNEPGVGERRLLALVRGHRMKRLLARMLDPQEFLSDYGIRALSRYHLEHPYVFQTTGASYTVKYEPAESSSFLFGGNSNWRGPVWFPPNYLLVTALGRFHHYYGDDFLVECPTGSGTLKTLSQAADDVSDRLCRIFLRGQDGRRAVFGSTELFQTDEHWRDYVPFYEYFHGDTGAGLGASHQTGWTAVVMRLLQRRDLPGDHVS